MPLDEATQRFAFLLQRDLRRISERREEHVARGEEIQFDSATRVARVHSRRGGVSSRLYGEVLATYAPHDRILRWAWAGNSSNASPTHGEVVFREGQARGVPQLTMSVVGDLDVDDARTLVKLGALVARAEDVHERLSAGEIEFIGIFDRSQPLDAEAARESRFSVPPPPVMERPEPKGPPARAYRSIPPIREIFEPRAGSNPPRPMSTATGGSGFGGTASSPPPAFPSAMPARSSPTSPPPPVALPPRSPLTAPPASPSAMPARSPRTSPPPPSVMPSREPSALTSALPSSPPSPSSPPIPKPQHPLREPSRALFLPVANAALAALTHGSKAYLQGLFVVTLDREPQHEHAHASETRRIVVQLVVVDAAGILRALDPPDDVVEAAATMVEADRREGNGHWRKLSARITPKPDGGATLHVDVT